MSAALAVTRTQVLAFRRRVQSLDQRLPAGPDSLRRAAWAGLQDSMPRAAVLSIHARVEGTQPDTWEDPSLVQLWGPRFSAYVVARRDVGVFSLGRLPAGAAKRTYALELAARLERFLDGRTMTYGEAGHSLGIPPNELRYAAPTGTVLIRWAGARQPTIWTVPAPQIDPDEAVRELARRYLHFFGPANAASFGRWAGIRPPRGEFAFSGLGPSLTAVRTPLGDGWVLAEDEPLLRAAAGPAADARLLPSGDTYFLLWGADRELLVPEADRRASLWTTRVWPGAVLVGGDIVGVWRRAGPTVVIDAWRRLGPRERAAVEGEAGSLPLPDLQSRPGVRWNG